MTSLDGLQKAKAPDFFYTRLIGKLQQETGVERKPFFLLRPVFVTATLSVILIVNMISLSLMNTQSTTKTFTRSNKGATIESFAEAYDMNATSVYE